MQSLQRFSHENIIKLKGIVHENMRVYLIFEFIDGGDLASFLDNAKDTKAEIPMHDIAAVM